MPEQEQASPQEVDEKQELPRLRELYRNNEDIINPVLENTMQIHLNMTFASVNKEFLPGYADKVEVGVDGINQLLNQRDDIKELFIDRLGVEVPLLLDDLLEDKKNVLNFIASTARSDFEFTPDTIVKLGDCQQFIEEFVAMTKGEE